jgi:hypothetical protein
MANAPTTTTTDLTIITKFPGGQLSEEDKARAEELREGIKAHFKEAARQHALMGKHEAGALEARKKRDEALIAAGMLLLEVRHRIEMERIWKTWKEWCGLHFDGKEREIRRAMQVARSDNPQAAIDAERERKKVSERKIRALAHQAKTEVKSGAMAPVPVTKDNPIEAVPEPVTPDEPQPIHRSTLSEQAAAVDCEEERGGLMEAWERASRKERHCFLAEINASRSKTGNITISTKKYLADLQSATHDGVNAVAAFFNQNKSVRRDNGLVIVTWDEVFFAKLEHCFADAQKTPPCLILSPIPTERAEATPQ